MLGFVRLTLFPDRNNNAWNDDEYVPSIPDVFAARTALERQTEMAAAGGEK